MKTIKVATMVMLIVACVIASIALTQPTAAAGNGQVSHEMKQTCTMLNVTSPAFKDGGRIPVKYTADGDDMSPPLSWSCAPPDVAEYVVTAQDPDAPGGTFTHWVIYRIPGNYDHLDEGIMQVSELDNGAMQGMTSFGKVGYGGPSPPKGKPHRYIFTVYALSASPDLPAGITIDQLFKAIQGNVIAEGSLTGLYGR
jgi:Raf kinase inhibitor-like YbhB/YbcL family protein